MELESWGAGQRWSWGAGQRWSWGAGRRWSWGAGQRWSWGAGQRWSWGAGQRWSSAAVELGSWAAGKRAWRAFEGGRAAAANFMLRAAPERGGEFVRICGDAHRRFNTYDGQICLCTCFDFTRYYASSVAIRNHRKGTGPGERSNLSFAKRHFFGDPSRRVRSTTRTWMNNRVIKTYLPIKMHISSGCQVGCVAQW